MPKKEDENTNAIALEVAKMLGVDILPSHISTFYHLLKTVNNCINSGSSLIIVHFTRYWKQNLCQPQKVSFSSAEESFNIQH